MTTELLRSGYSNISCTEDQCAAFSGAVMSSQCRRRRSGRSGHGRTRIRHIPFKFNSLLARSNESYCLKLNSRISFWVVPTVLTELEVSIEKKKIVFLKKLQLQAPKFLYSQNSTLPKEALAKFYFSTTFGLSFMISSVAPTQSSTFYTYLITKIGNRNFESDYMEFLALGIFFQSNRKF